MNSTVRTSLSATLFAPEPSLTPTSGEARAASSGPGLAFTVLGTPVPKGSLKQVPVRRKGGGVVMGPNGPVMNTVHDNPALEPWMQAVASMALMHRQAAGWELLRGVAIAVTCRFFMPRNKGDFGTGRNAALLKPSAPRHHVKKPDVDKLVRGILDPLTGVIYGDDGQVVAANGRKFFCAPQDTPRAEVLVRVLSD
jgi:Holliday junction resolvase RusA-like endonuclease